MLNKPVKKQGKTIGYCRVSSPKKKKLLNYFEDLAREKGFKYITLGSKEDEFYKKCGYNVIL